MHARVPNTLNKNTLNKHTLNTLTYTSHAEMMFRSAASGAARATMSGPAAVATGSRGCGAVAGDAGAALARPLHSLAIEARGEWNSQPLGARMLTVPRNAPAEAAFTRPLPARGQWAGVALQPVATASATAAAPAEAAFTRPLPARGQWAGVALQPVATASATAAAYDPTTPAAAAEPLGFGDMTLASARAAAAGLSAPRGEWRGQLVPPESALAQKARVMLGMDLSSCLAEPRGEWQGSLFPPEAQAMADRVQQLSKAESRGELMPPEANSYRSLIEAMSKRGMVSIVKLARQMQQMPPPAKVQSAQQ